MRPLIEHLICGPDLAKAEFPVRESLISPWLTTASLSMIYAPTGVGKTWFAMEQIRALTKGTPFLGWQVTRPCRALYIDGELPGAVIRERFNFLYGGPLPESLTLLPSEYLMKEGAPLDLSTRSGQARITGLLEAMELRSLRPDLIVVDNLSSLTSADENDNTAQTLLLQWLMHLRHLQYAVQIVHHTGKSGDQRGASRRKDFMDAVISLTPTGTEGAGFKVEFAKWRCKSKPKSATWALETGEHGEAIWSSSETAPPQWKVSLKVICTAGPKDVTAIGRLMGITRQAAQKHVESLRIKGFLKANGLDPTPDGTRLVNELAAVEEL
jgi:putative DNA primase/helicase